MVGGSPVDGAPGGPRPLEGVVAQVTEYDGETHFVGGFEHYVLDTESEPET